MAGLYSYRFIATDVGGSFLTWSVPVGQRAVVKCVTAYNATETDGALDMYVGGVVALHVVVPALKTVVQTGLQLVAFGGEGITLYVQRNAIHTSVHGYLLHDTTRHSEDPLEVTEAPPPKGWANIEGEVPSGS